MARAHRRPVWAEIDRAAMVGNARRMLTVAEPARLCAVVKADGYGHGAIDSAKAFLEGGASWLAVALAEEGIELRRAGITAPTLLLSEPGAGGMEEAVVHRLTPTVYTLDGLDALEHAQARLGDGRSPIPVHVKVDTGMHRVGTTPEIARALLARIEASKAVVLGGLWTHLAVADEPGNAYTDRQLSLFSGFVDSTQVSEEVLVHAANSAATFLKPASRLSMVRCGLSLYGYVPGAQAGSSGLVPVMSLKARVSYVKELAAGERLSYGLAYVTKTKTVIATVPLGYADGVPRRFGTAGGEALVGGRRCPVAGHVTMDQLMIDCGESSSVMPGDEVVLLGRQGAEMITAEDWAHWLEVIPYEVLCGIGSRVPRVVV